MEAPKTLTGEAKLEWKRVCDELAKLGRLTDVDRAILTVHCQTWAINRDAFAAVKAHGMSTTYSNGSVGPTPEYKAWTETTKTLRGTLADLGLTPAARKFDKVEAEEPTKLSY